MMKVDLNPAEVNERLSIRLLMHRIKQLSLLLFESAKNALHILKKWIVEFYHSFRADLKC